MMRCVCGLWFLGLSLVFGCDGSGGSDDAQTPDQPDGGAGQDGDAGQDAGGGSDAPDDGKDGDKGKVDADGDGDGDGDGDDDDLKGPLDEGVKVEAPTGSAIVRYAPLVIDDDGNLYLFRTDTANSTSTKRIFKFDEHGKPVAGFSGASTNGTFGGYAERYLIVDDKIFFADSKLSVFDAKSGSEVSGSPFSGDGTLKGRLFKNSDGNIFVPAYSAANDNIKMFTYDVDGASLTETATSGDGATNFKNLSTMVAHTSGGFIAYGSGSGTDKANTFDATGAFTATSTVTLPGAYSSTDLMTVIADASFNDYLVMSSFGGMGHAVGIVKVASGTATEHKALSTECPKGIEMTAAHGTDIFVSCNQGMPATHSIIYKISMTDGALTTVLDSTKSDVSVFAVDQDGEVYYLEASPLSASPLDPHTYLLKKLAH
jgi:hypothetical protein